MNINELETYKLSDAVKFNDKLNPRLWDNEHLRPEVEQKLRAIADDFREFLGIKELDVEDITISGSNAAYTYTPHSDIDLHLVVDLDKVCSSEVYRELFDAKKYQYNDQHNFKIGGYDVELYVQDAREPHHSQGIYSLTNNRWINVPNRRLPKVDDISVKNKYQDIGARIDDAIASGDLERMDAMRKKIRTMRQAGLDKTGEFGPENLAFKVLRGNGTLKRLHDARQAAKDKLMSLDERKTPAKPRKIYGFKNFWSPEVDDNVIEAEDSDKDIEQIIKPFVDSCVEYLEIENPPKIVIHRGSEWTKDNGTFGRFDTDTHTVNLAVSNRHPLDILRTLAHELTHARQDELATMPVDAGVTGSPYEDEANAMAGRIMRHWVDNYPEFFKSIELSEQLDKPTPSARDIIAKHKMSEDDLVRQLKMGIAVELEHTRDPKTAMEIALDHINEFPDYYDRLKKAEAPVDEGLKDRLAAAAAAACIAGTPGCATTQGGMTASDALKGIQTVGRTAQTMKGYGRAGAEEELMQQLKNQLRKKHQGINEATGYIPVNDAEARDPRYSMAITQDIKPGEVQRQARKMGFSTNAAGIPPTLKTSGKIK